jgi:anti-anti-sigma factor
MEKKMPIQPFEARVRRQGDVAIIDLEGDIDGDAEQGLEDAYARAEGGEAEAILLNFAGVDYINSKGIALIVVLLRRAMGSGRRLLACALSDHYQEIFQITQLSNYIAVCSDETSALTQVRPQVAALG